MCHSRQYEDKKFMVYRKQLNQKGLKQCQQKYVRSINIKFQIELKAIQRSNYIFNGHHKYDFLELISM
jgi:hypothetical protein